MKKNSMYGKGNPAKGWYNFWDAFLSSQNNYDYRFQKEQPALDGNTDKREVMRPRGRRHAISTGLWVSYGMNDSDGTRVIVLTTKGDRPLLAVRSNGDFLVSIYTAYDRYKLSSLTFLKATYYARSNAYLVGTEWDWWQGSNINDYKSPLPYVDETLLNGNIWGARATGKAAWWKIQKSDERNSKWEIAPVARRGFYNDIKSIKYRYGYGGGSGYRTRWESQIARREDRYKRLRRNAERDEGAPGPSKREVSQEQVEAIVAHLDLEAPAKKVGRLDVHQFRKHTEGAKA